MSILELSFFRNALVMGMLLSLLFGVLSFFIVMRKMSFLGAGIAHTAFGGVALGIFLGIDPFITSLGFCVIVAVLTGKLVRVGTMSYDVIIGIFFSFSMALGAMLIALKKDYSFDLMGYLFGNILGVTVRDNLIALVAVLIFIPFMAIFLQRILFMTFDREAAAVSGVNTGALDTLLLVFLAGIIVVSIKMVGIILVSALVVLPASFGSLLSKDYRKVILFGCIYTAVIMTGGLFLSYFFNTPAGATMVTIGTLIYFTGIGIQKIHGRE